MAKLDPTLHTHHKRLEPPLWTRGNYTQPLGYKASDDELMLGFVVIVK